MTNTDPPGFGIRPAGPADGAALFAHVGPLDRLPGAQALFPVLLIELNPSG